MPVTGGNSNKRAAAIAAMGNVLSPQPSGSNAFQAQKTEQTPVSKPAWKNITPPQGP